MSTNDTEKNGRSSFNEIAQHFNPAWFAAVMGTAVIPLALSFIPSPLVKPVAGAFIVLAGIMFLALLAPWMWRFIKYPDAVRRDLSHPVAANFFPTMPISLIIIALDLLKYPDLFFQPAVAREIAFYLWLVGALSIYGFGFVILERIYRHAGIKLSHANFGWYIPPVSKLLIPVAGFELAQIFPSRTELTFGLSIISLGVGFFLFLFVGAAVYHRHIFEELPMSRFAATFFIGIAPPAIMAVILFKMMHLFEAQPVIGIDPHVFGSMAKLGILMTWGFALWWFIMALLVVAYYLRRLDLPYALSWWAFTFPVGALGVASGVAWKVSGFGFIQAIYYGTLVFLLVVWTVVLVRTLRGVISGQAFTPTH
jgi:C4-dicarboxylate transporter/malic acid transport protein